VDKHQQKMTHISESRLLLMAESWAWESSLKPSPALCQRFSWS